MKLYKLVIWSGDEEYSTKGFIVSEEDFRKYQNVIVEGKEFLVLDDKIIRTNQIKEILPATDRDIQEFEMAGKLPFSKAGDLPEPSKEAVKEADKRGKQGLKKLSDWVRQQSWYKEWERKSRVNK